MNEKRGRDRQKVKNKTFSGFKKSMLLFYYCLRVRLFSSKGKRVRVSVYMCIDVISDNT